MEIFATMTMTAAIVIAVALAIGPREARRRLIRTVGPVAAGYAVAIALVSPYLIYFFRESSLQVPMWRIETYSADLLNFVVPTRTLALGGAPAIAAISGTFGIGAADSGAYLGIPLIVVVAAFALSRWRERAARTLVL